MAQSSLRSEAGSAPPDRPCPVCDGGECAVMHTQRFVLPEDHPLRDGYKVVCCDRCGFVYASTPANQADYDAFYAKFSKYEDNTTSTGSGVTPWDAERLEGTAADLTRFIPDRAARIVDIGCANGGLLAALKARGYENLCGVDPSPGCARYVRDQLGIEAYPGLLTRLPDELGSVDAVLLSHVMEHVRELRPALEAVREVMKPGAILYAEVPDATRYVDFLFAPFQDFNTEHINHFSHDSLANLLRACGLQPVESGRRMLMTSPGMPYPAIYAVGLGSAVSLPVPAEAVTKDQTLRPAIAAYIAGSARLLAAIDLKIRRVLESSGPILVWGAGQLAMKLLAETSLGQAEIAAFVDGNPIHHGKTIRGVPVLAPEQIRGMAHPILITSTLHEREIVEKISQMGLNHHVLCLGAESDVRNSS